MGMDIYGRKPEHEVGEYFRRNVWGWRPLHFMSALVMYREGLKYDTDGWGSNDGNGLKNKSQCHKLARGFEKMLEEWHNIPEEGLLYLNLGYWVKEGGQFFDQSIYKEEIERLSPDYGAIMTEGLVMSDGVKIEPAYCTTKRSVQEWVQFLYACGGFKIY